MTAKDLNLYYWASHSRFPPSLFGTAEWTRTTDLSLIKQLLYQLSYHSIEFFKSRRVLSPRVICNLSVLLLSRCVSDSNRCLPLRRRPRPLDECTTITVNLKSSLNLEHGFLPTPTTMQQLSQIPQTYVPENRLGFSILCTISGFAKPDNSTHQFGDEDWIRTSDLTINLGSLYQLSYFIHCLFGGLARVASQLVP